MPEKYGTHEVAALIVLTQEKREVPNSELTNDYGINLRPPARDKLNKAGLIRTRKEKGRYVHEITDTGVVRCAEELAGVEAPARTGPLVRMVFEVFRRMVLELRKRDVRLVELIRPADLESLIREAYAELATKQRDWVRLAKLRTRLDGAEKDDVDQVLLAMSRTGLVHLAPDSNRKALTDADHDAAIRIGSENKHLVAIEES